MSYIKAVSYVSIVTVITSLLGFLREILIAKNFGIGSEIDCFVVAFSIISFVFLIFNPTTIQSLFMPSYQGFLKTGKAQEASQIFNSFFLILFIILSLLSMFIYCLATFYVPWIAPGFDENQVQLTIKLTKILTPLILLFGISSLFNSLCNSHHSFVGPLLTQTLNNFCVIAFLMVSENNTIVKLSYLYVFGAVAAFFLMTAYTVPYIERNFSFSRHYVLRSVGKESSFLFLLIIFDQIAALFQKTIASGLDQGSISSLNYASKLVSFPVSIFAIAISTVSFPILINTIQEKTSKGLESKLDYHFKQGIILIIYSLLPATIFFIVERYNIVSILFSSKNFDQIAVDKTSSALLYYAIGMIFQGLLIYLNRVYFAHKQAKLFVKLGLISVVIHAILCWVCAQFIGHSGIALATSVYALINILLLFYYMRTFSPLHFKVSTLIKPSLSAIITLVLLPQFHSKGGVLKLCIQAFLTVMLFYGTLILLKDKNLKEIIRTALMSNGSFAKLFKFFTSKAKKRVNLDA